MKTAETPIKKEKTSNPIDKNLKGIKNHKEAAKHLQAAAKSHLDAATHHEEGNHQKAAQSTITAHGHVNLAKKAQKADVKQHAFNG
ncbi:hypothetical protein [Snuella lapsa]|uniref:Uncharacterized protein n=1 Tax=Snuella lapsa TaxID=870481 RepID=A0ABP6X474_9FLAO